MDTEDPRMHRQLPIPPTEKDPTEERSQDKLAFPKGKEVEFSLSILIAFPPRYKCNPQKKIPLNKLGELKAHFLWYEEKDRPAYDGKDIIKTAAI